MAACPVAAIRIDDGAGCEMDDKQLKRSLSIGKDDDPLFPRPLLDNIDLGVYYLCHHNDASFGATPYLVLGKSSNGNNITVMVDVPRFSASAVRAVKSLAPKGPDYLFLTHADDTADHNAWVAEFPMLKRIFHSGDLGIHNWIGDETLEDVEILLRGESVREEDELMVWDIEGNELGRGIKYINELKEMQFRILHTPGHSPGSITLMYQPSCQERAVLFTGDTYAWTTRDGGHMSGFPRYGNNLSKQAKTLQLIGMLADRWNIIAPGHGHPRVYHGDDSQKRQLEELDTAIDELKLH
jgi:glyoxylase-like metal-dependent hydrolase (beta-lactamase superfamily II)